MTTLWSQFPAIIILVTGTHQYFIHNTLGGSKESPLPRKNFKTARSFYFARFSLYICIQNKRNPCLQGFLKSKSTRRDSNPRPSPWQGDTPPLSHSCKICCAVTVSATKHMIPENGTFVNRYFLSFRSFHFHSGSAGCPHTYCLGNLFPECCPVSGIPGQTTALLRSPAYVPVQYLHQRD